MQTILPWRKTLCTKARFFQLHPDHFVGCSLSLAFCEWVNDCSWCCRPLLCSLLTSVLAVACPMVPETGAAFLCAGNGPHLEQQVVTTLQESRSSHCCQRPLHVFRGQKPLCHGFPLVRGSKSMWGLWGFFKGPCQAREALPGVAPNRGCVQYVYWCCLSCFVPWFSSKGMLWFTQCTA